MDKSIFTDKRITPAEEALAVTLGNTYPYWTEIREHVHSLYPQAVDEWNYAGEKYGWSFRIKDKKRVIAYLLPRDSYFKVALVFGQKATDTILAGAIAETIKAELAAAKAYAEGRGIRIDVRDPAILTDIRELIRIKLVQ